MTEVTNRTIGKYRLYDRIGSGGMGSVHLGRFFAPGGFRRIVAIKRLHPQFTEDAAFVSAFLDEARLASRIHHPNVVAPLDVVAQGGEVFLVFEHVLGLSLSKLLHLAKEKGESVPPRVATSVMVNVLHGLHAAHEAKGDNGEILGLVHRDVSPQNVIVGRDGAARLLDFGIAKATGRSQTTDEGIVKGKRGYMAPEHLIGMTSRASDLYSAAVVLWEIVTKTRLFKDDSSIPERLAGKAISPPSTLAPVASEEETKILRALDAIVLRGLAHDPEQRFPTAREMAIAIEDVGVATSREVAEWAVHIARAELEERARLVERAEAAAGLIEEPSSNPELSTMVPMVEDPRLRSRRRFFRVAGVLTLVTVCAGVLALAMADRASKGDAKGGAKSEVVAAPERAPPAPSTSSSSPPTASAPSPQTTAVDLKSETIATKPRAATHATPAKRRSDQDCKPYVIAKSGRTLFNEACLR